MALELRRHGGKLMLHFVGGVAELARDLGAYHGEAEEKAIGTPAKGEIEEGKGAEGTMAFEGIE